MAESTKMGFTRLACLVSVVHYLLLVEGLQLNTAGWEANWESFMRESDLDLESSQRRNLQEKYSLKRPSKTSSFVTKSCMAEEICVEEACGAGYDHSAKKFPYAVNYTRSVTDAETIFTFKFCTKPCEEGADLCESPNLFALRLDTELVKSGLWIKQSIPEGKVISKCEETGLGFKWENEQMGGLQAHDPSKGELCQDFVLVLTNDPNTHGGYWLTDLCQQSIDIVSSKAGRKMSSQMSLVVTRDKYSDVGTCMVHFRTASGKYAFTILEDADYELLDRRKTEIPADLDQRQIFG